MNEVSGLPSDVEAGWLARRIRIGNARDIAASIRDLVDAGQLPRGRKLPTVRMMAKATGVSVGTIASAWGMLRDDGIVRTQRRGGSIIADNRPQPQAPAVPSAWTDWVSVDLAQGVPDPALQPGLDAALVAGSRTPNLNSPYREYITPALREAVQADWPFVPEAWFTAGGGSEGIVLAAEAAAMAGDAVAIEQPTSPRLLAVIEKLGFKPVGVACDAEGPLPEALAAVLRQHRPRAFFYQPRAHVPLGLRVSDARLEALAEVLSGFGGEVSIVEDDNTGPLSESSVPSLGDRFPGQVLHVRTYCKTYGVDLRTCVVGGAERLVQRMAEKRSHGMVMNSRILQDALAHLISSSEVKLVIDHARQRYAWRRQTLMRALARHGLGAGNPDGLMLWLTVPDENAALLALATYGITVGAGRKCFIDPPATGHLRIAVSRLPDDEDAIGQLAELVATALRGKPRPEFD